MADSSITTVSVAGITTLTFNRPSIDLSMAHEMRDIASRIADDRTSRVIVLRGGGNTFLVGGDVRSFAANLDNISTFAGEVVACFHSFVKALSQAPQPVLGSIHGAAAGAGLSLLTACDLVIAAQSTKLAFAYKVLGVSPDGGATYFLSRAVGAKRAAELLLARDTLTAAEAKDMGLLNWVVADADLAAETHAIAERLASNSATANGITKALLRQSTDMSLSQQLAAEEDGFIACARHGDFSEGVNAFLGKRRPSFARN